VVAGQQPELNVILRLMPPEPENARWDEDRGPGTTDQGRTKDQGPGPTDQDAGPKVQEQRPTVEAEPVRRVVVITGGSAGIGRATALRLARDGAALVMCARRADRLEATAADVRAAGGEALPIVADVTRPDEMRRLVDAAVERFSRVDVMMCNAGFGVAGAIDDIPPDQMRRLVDVNYMGTYHAVRAVLPLFRRHNRGHVIIVSSIVGKRGVPYLGAYAATKFAQAGLAECLRAEVAGSGIYVSVVYPVSTDTEFFDVMSRETGTPVTRAHGPRQDAAFVADAIARTIDHPAPEVYPYAWSRALVWLNAAAPGVCDRFVQRFGRRPIPVKS
jgi:short-subunit dehydrogenase